MRNSRVKQLHRKVTDQPFAYCRLTIRRKQDTPLFNRLPVQPARLGRKRVSQQRFILRGLASDVRTRSHTEPCRPHLFQPDMQSGSRPTGIGKTNWAASVVSSAMKRTAKTIQVDGSSRKSIGSVARPRTSLGALCLPPHCLLALANVQHHGSLRETLISHWPTPSCPAPTSHDAIAGLQELQHL